MHAKPEMLMAIISPWMMAAVVCAALPLMHAIEFLEAISAFAPFFAALIIGVATTLPLGIVTRRLCGISVQTKNVWADLPTGSTAFLGLISFGLPVGLIFVLEWFLQFKVWSIVIPGAIVWPLGGVAFGMVMRKLARSQ